MTSAPLCRAQGGPDSCADPDCPRKRYEQAQLAAKQWTLADSIRDVQRVEAQDRTRRLRARLTDEFFTTELGDHFEAASLRIAPDGHTFTLRVDMPVHLQGVDYPEGATFTGDAAVFEILSPSRPF